jgi:hypothetical protein
MWAYFWHLFGSPYFGGAVTRISPGKPGLFSFRVGEIRALSEVRRIQ